MKDQRGFFTVIGLCFLLAASICIKNIQESQAIFNFSVADFQAELELQNAVDSSLLEAAEIIQKNYSDKLDMQKASDTFHLSRKYRQYKVEEVSKIISSDRLGKIDLEVYFEFGNIHSELGKESDSTAPADREGVILIGVASSNSRIADKKIYRRSLAFFEMSAPEKIYFLGDL